MRIQNNITAQNSHRQYGINNNNIGKSVEKLSSGYRVNRAADDAAGLAISEKMRTQIRGLSVASRNSQDGISLVQTAEGAMQSAHDIMQRMRELAVQASNGTNDDDVDRKSLDLEYQQLNSELKQIESTVKFNDMSIFGRDFTLQTGANSGDITTFSVGNMENVSGAFYTLRALDEPDTLIEAPSAGAPFTQYPLTWTLYYGAFSNKFPDGVFTEEFVEDMITKRAEEQGWDASSTTVRNTIRTELASHSMSAGAEAKAEDWILPTANATWENALFVVTWPKEFVTEIIDEELFPSGEKDYLNPNLWDAARTVLENEDWFDFISTNSIANFEAGLTNIEDAQTSLIALTATINALSTTRASLGAIQNRLEFKVQNLDNSAENLTAAESRIRDVDMAKQMTEFTKNNILMQASTAMLAQANALPQGVLQLLG